MSELGGLAHLMYLLIYPERMMKRGFELYTVHDRDKPTQYMVTFYTQPYWRIVVSNIYLTYDMTICRLPGYSLLSKLYDWFHKKDIRWYVPLSAMQDMRAYYLSAKGKTALVTIELTEEEYNKIKGCPVCPD